MFRPFSEYGSFDKRLIRTRARNLFCSKQTELACKPYNGMVGTNMDNEQWHVGISPKEDS